MLCSVKEQRLGSAYKLVEMFGVFSTGTGVSSFISVSLKTLLLLDNLKGVKGFWVVRRKSVSFSVK